MVTDQLMADVAILKERCQVYEALLRQAEEALDYLMDYIGQLERVIFPSSVDEAWEVTDGTAILQAIREHLGEEHRDA